MPTLTGAFNWISSSPLSSAFTQLTRPYGGEKEVPVPYISQTLGILQTPLAFFFLSGQEGGKGHSTHVEVKGHLVGVSFLTTWVLEIKFKS